MVDQLTQHDPRRIGPFEVLGRLGAGGMGLVYLARSASGRRVAIKTVRTELAEDQLFRVRFTREVEAARAVSGFYTAAVVDADPRAAVPWLATAYVPAPSLEEIVNECGPLPAQAVRWLAAGVAEALQSIHGAGLVHRDLKPSNVLVVEDGPRVIDFGIASGVSNTRLTMTNVAVGTPAYMSPEQAKDSRSVTGASDVFSLGSMLVFAATGHPPFHGANPVETVFMLLREGPDLEGLPDELRPLIEACMQMEATGRPNPADLQSQLAPHLFGSGSDDSGTASAWLPERAVGLIEGRRNGRPAPRPAGAPGGRGPGGARPPVPAAPPLPPPPAHDPAVPAPPAHGPAIPAPVGAPDAGPVRLAGAAVPIGPGPRVADTRAAAVAAPRPESALSASWSRPRPGVNGADPAVPAAPPEASPAGWRPWRFRMSNDVWGTPRVAEDLVYVTSFEVHALDVATGRRRFKTRDVAWSMAVADGRVHASDGPTLFALNAREGADLWRVQTDAWVYSLHADRGTVLTATRGGGVQAWEASSGQKLWELTGAQTDFESAEAGAVLHEGTAYVWQDARLRALDARTGDERWSYPIGDAASCGGVPVRLAQAPDGHVYVAAGTRVLALEVASGHVRWHFEAPAVFLAPPTFVPGPAVTGGGIYLADYLGTVYALDATDGRDRWRIATEARSSTDPVLVAAGHVHVGSGKGLYTLDAVTGTPKWRFQAGGDIVGAPAVAEGRIHFGSTDHLLYTLKSDDGRLRWKLATGGEITGSPVVRDGIVYACSKDRCVYALDAEKGTGTARTT
ncbi:PQQ-binding-like beta-propeller repeat protein [Streptomyces olivaceus]|uniref:non-specific serine/threonine protein kinase n=1 Tax=Streptomyces olivaceus TaxID=47716 RepID=A0ABS7W756_STROV|nr:PQQ-binding-like beta-propeller repeat protein [Streptomyces olivaceus]MBZ6090788.1 PQQ-binding-like beta-propeller repeat protein [Streptomyces olivaceus]MBZ6096963.1 PQQ-binding-like beta-propeller repeat protein [Streptomyces olivaceus]MBZ6119500.1 PQQ-binding-like beta-propeller repeat protein [Streptomyces olivaceus]MBZ6153288.1 PQQ-binding-like beta-propeller repeat protein [Streptomyces olivaceus]MBZ6299371.1 PQQ-binding-like beta-propeller repeat protein [Streptomyces olivaceus]